MTDPLESSPRQGWKLEILMTQLLIGPPSCSWPQVFQVSQTSFDPQGLAQPLLSWGHSHSYPVPSLGPVSSLGHGVCPMLGAVFCRACSLICVVRRGERVWQCQSSHKYSLSAYSVPGTGDNTDTVPAFPELTLK